MRHLVSSFILLVLIVSCQSDPQTNQTPKKEDPHPLETKMYNCIKAEYLKAGVSVEDYLYNLEKLTLETGNLKDTTAAAYYQMFKASAEKSHFPLGNDAYYFHYLAKIPNFPLNMACPDQNLSSKKEIENSRFYKFNRAFSVELIESGKTASQVNIGKVVMKVYKEEDFENEYIRLSLLSFIAHRAYVENPIYENN
jgi:hypothetical protein